MKRVLSIIIFITGLSTITFGQKYFTKTGHVTFISQAPLETIQATNNNAFIVFDAATGQIEFSVLVKGFAFEKALMQDHFNENYLESDKFPKSLFKGILINWSDVHLMNDHVYQVNASGNLTMHGVTKPFQCPATLSMNSDGISTLATFEITIADFDIEIPKVVRDNISKTVKVTVKADLQPMK